MLSTILLRLDSLCCLGRKGQVELAMENNAIITLLYYSYSLLILYSPMQHILPPSAERSISSMNQILSCFCLKQTNSFPLCLTSLCLLCVLQGHQVKLAVWVDVLHQLWKLLKALSLQIFTFAVFLSQLLLQLPLCILRYFMLFHRAWMRAKGLALV